MMGGFLEDIRIALVGLQSNRLRAFLTLIGITIGVTAVILLISLGQAVQGFVRSQILSIGSNLITAFPSRDEDGHFEQFTMKEVMALSDPLWVSGVSVVMPIYNVNQSVSYGGREISVQTQGVTPDYLSLRNRRLVHGRFFTQEEQTTRARVAVIGQTTARNLFDSAAEAVGKSIRIGRVRFTVIGVLNVSGGSGPGGSNDDIILVPLDTAQLRLSRERSITGDLPVSTIMMQAANAETVTETVDEITRVLREVRELKTDEADNFNVFSQQTILDTLTSITGLLTIFLGVIAGISLLVGGIGVMNIMMVTVTERTREIGLRKAVGAQNSSILMQFLVESMVLSLLGGSVGIALAFGLAAVAGSLISSLALQVQASSVVLATAVSAGVGIFFGIYPARRAAALNPIDALRYE